MADEGSITYPYSTREVVNIVKHLQVQASRRDIGINVLITLSYRGSPMMVWELWSGMFLTLTGTARR